MSFEGRAARERKSVRELTVNDLEGGSKDALVPPTDRLLVDGNDVLTRHKGKERVNSASRRVGSGEESALTWWAISMTGCKSAFLPFQVKTVP